MGEEQRVDYDVIAHLYDGQPYRGKEADAALAAFSAEGDGPNGRRPAELSVLDVGCGTGNQLAANRAQWPGMRLVGVDLFSGMLRQAQEKEAAIDWVQGDGSALPLAAGSFDYVSNQFSFHHVRRKQAFLANVYRVLRKNGRFVMINIAPRRMQGWIYYRFFPEAYALDLMDYWSMERLVVEMEAAGFRKVTTEFDRQVQTVSLTEFARTASHRDNASQLMAISAAAYEAGRQRLAGAKAAGETSVQSEFCLMTLSGER